MAKIIKTKEELAKHKDKVVIGLPKYSFIPHRLHISKNLELNVFPYNILFMSIRYYYGQMQSGSSLYEPVLESYKKEKRVHRLLYVNRYNGNDSVRIEYDEDTNEYKGFKYIRGKLVQETSAIGWQSFFVLLTAPGLKDGEKCVFEKID